MGIQEDRDKAEARTAASALAMFARDGKTRTVIEVCMRRSHGFDTVEERVTYFWVVNERILSGVASRLHDIVTWGHWVIVYADGFAPGGKTLFSYKPRKVQL